jgi:hypothetical protein
MSNWLTDSIPLPLWAELMAVFFAYLGGIMTMTLPLFNFKGKDEDNEY